MKRSEKGSIELIVLGLLAALIVVLAIPLLTGIGDTTRKSLNVVNNQMSNQINNLNLQ